jgi:hypothetical protein
METSPSAEGGLRSELRSDAATIAETTKQRLHSEADARKGTAAEQTRSFSSALDTAASELQDGPDWLRSAFKQGARTLQQFADTIEKKDSRELTREVQQLAREHPGTFLASCAMAGFAAARVLKSGAEETSGSAASRTGSPELYDRYRQPAAAPTGTAFAGLTDSEAAAQPPYQGEM